jgi:hypothetical protein
MGDKKRLSDAIFASVIKEMAEPPANRIRAKKHSTAGTDFKSSQEILTTTHTR